MKILLFVFAIISSIASTAQSISIQSLWKKQEPAVYIGLRNELLLKGDLQSITSINSATASISRVDNLLYVSPKIPGELIIEVTTPIGKQSFSFNSSYLPDLDIRLFEGQLPITSELRDHQLNAIDKLGIRVPEQADDSLFDEYRITHSIISVNGKTFEVAGNVLSDGIRRALTSLRRENSIVIEEVTLMNEFTNKILIIRTNQKYTVK